MQESKRAIGQAQQAAESGFAELCERMVGEADAALGDALRTAPLDQQRALGQARMFLREEGRAFRARLQASYATLLDRAMQTMHTDLRSGLMDFRADTLTLIDDEVVTRQIEVDRLVLRLRDADELNLGHLNLIIANLHGASEVKERENPFRPYLMARALYDAMRAMVHDEALSKLLFDQLAAAMTAQLAGFYGRLREVFEARGMRARLVAQPTALSRREQDRLAWQRAVAGLDEQDMALRARLQRMVEMQQVAAGGGFGSFGGAAAAGSMGAGGMGSVAAGGAGIGHAAMGGASMGGAAGHAAGGVQNLQELVWNVFNQPKAMPSPRQAPEVRRSQLDAELRLLQQAKPGTPGPSPLALREQLSALPPGPERLSVDLLALLFEFILNDEMLPLPLRVQLCRLHAPFLRAALHTPELLHDASHPARRLLDRIGTAAAGIRADAPLYPLLLAEVERLIDGVLAQFDQDPVVFADAETELEAFLTRQLRADPRVARCALAMERAEVAAPLLLSAGEALRGLMEPVKVDRRMIDFVTGPWLQVLVHTYARQPAFRDFLPELVWSAQERPLPEERAALMKLLPGLGPRLRAGLAAIGMPEAEAAPLLDQLLSLHMDVLANKQLRSQPTRMTLDELRVHFAQLKLEHLAAQIQAQGMHEGLAPATRAQFAAELAVDGIDAVLLPEPAQAAALPSDEEWLQWARPGNGFEVLEAGSYVAMRLEAASPRRQAFVFGAPHAAPPLVYPRAALLVALRDGSVRPLEYAPLFDRAVESLMTGAESLSAA